MTECFNVIKTVAGRFGGRLSLFAALLRVAAPCALALVGVLWLSGCGCGRKDKSEAAESGRTDQIPSRIEDKEYVATLFAHQDAITAVAQQRHELGEQMRETAAKIKDALPADADEESVKAALAESAEWQELLKREAAVSTSVTNTLLEARRTIRERILREEREKAEAAAAR